jgi:hypothetical protein
LGWQDKCNTPAMPTTAKTSHGIEIAAILEALEGRDEQ